MNAEEKYKFAQEKLKGFSNSIEIEDFRKFLLLILNLESGGPEALMKQMGLAPKGKTVLPYDPEKKIYFTKIISGLSMDSQLIVYNRVEGKLSEDFVNKPDSPLFEKYLTQYEREKQLPKNFLLVTPEIVDFTREVLTEKNETKPVSSGIEAMYVHLDEFLATQGLKFVFIIEGKDDEPDLVFTMNMTFEPKHDSSHRIQYFDIYVSENKELRGKSFIQMKQEKDKKLELSFLDEIKELSHSEQYNSKFTIIIPIKSFDQV